MYMAYKFNNAECQKEKGGVSRMFLRQWLIFHHFVDVNEMKIKFTNVSDVLMKYCTKCGEAEMAFNNSPQNLRQIHKYIKESDENNEGELL